MPLAPSKPSSTLQAYFRIEPTPPALVHDARLVIAEYSQSTDDCRLLLRALGIAPREIGIVTG